MHELSIALNILDLAAEETERQGGGRVVVVHLRLGPLSGVAKEALASAYELACEAGAAHPSRLVIEEVPIVVHCSTCDASRTLASAQLLCCPDCGTPTPEILSGHELEVVALEVET
jgi:hydrogenase nickel incorporation protein HypA/HybF